MTQNESDPIITPDQVGQWVREAVSVMARLPSGKPLGYRSFWPDFLDDYAGKGRSISQPPTRDEIEKLDYVLSWLDTLDVVTKKVLWQRGEKKGWSDIARQLPYSVRYLQGKRDTALMQIAKHLNRDLHFLTHVLVRWQDTNQLPKF